MTGLSQVNFDVQDLADEEEAELDKEDAERKQELHEFLSNELPDDLLDDDNISFSSPGNSTQGRQTPEFQTNQSYDHLEENHGQGLAKNAQPECPQINKISMLLTQRGEEFIQRFTSSPPPDNMYHAPLDSVARGYHHHEGHGYAEAQGGFGEDNNEHQGQYMYHDGNNLPSGDEFSPDDGDYGDLGDFYGDTDYTGHDENFNVVYSRLRTEPDPQQANTSVTNSDIIDNFQVQYKHGARTLKVSESQEEVIQSQGSLGQTSVSPSTVELAQLQILHRARKRKLEEVTNEFSRKEKEYERQMRVMNHKLALMKGERDGMQSSVKHAQEMAIARKNELDELACKLQNSDFEKEQINNEKSEMEAELDSAKKTIASLHKQLMELEKSESLSRAREQHENVVMATKKRHEEDLARLKQKLDEVNNSLMWKEEESKRLHDELLLARKESDRVRLDRAETVNRLTKSLEESQKRNEELLNSGSNQELSQLKRELSITQHQKETLEQRNKTIESDIEDLKEQLRTYESMSKLGVTIQNGDGVKRNLEADEWRTPVQSVPPQRKFSTEEALVGLQKELQVSLTSNRNKRDEIEQLRSELEELHKHLLSKENETERLEMLVTKQEMRVLEQEKQISELEKLNKSSECQVVYGDEDKLIKLQELVKEQDSKLQQYVERGNDLERKNSQLKSQMSQMVSEYDTDKQKSIEQCRQSCLEFHQRATTTLKQQLTSEHEQELEKLRQELETVTTELNQAKESYVVLSEESRWIEKQTREHCEEEANERLKENQSRWNEEKSCEMLALRGTFATEMERNLKKEKLKWREAEEERMKSKIETEMAIAKMDWIKDQQETIQNAVTMAEKEWEVNHRHATECQTELENKMTQLKELEQKLEELRAEKAHEQEERAKVAHQEYERLKIAAIEVEVARVRKDCEEQLTKAVEKAEQKAVEKARQAWLDEQNVQSKMSTARNLDLALSTAKMDWEKEKDLQITNVLASEKEKWLSAVAAEKQQAIELAVSLAEERWNDEHTSKVSIAVKEALDLAKATWRKEQDSAIESAVTRSLHSAKETWNENKMKEIEQVLSNARRQWFSELNIHKQEPVTSPRSRKSISSSEEVSKTFNYLEAQYSKSLKEFRATEVQRMLEQHERNLSDAVEKLETKHERQLREQEEKHQSEVQNRIGKLQEEHDSEIDKLETEYQSKLETIVQEMEGKWREKKTTLERDWTEKCIKQREELRASFREKYAKERESLAQQMREKYEKGVEHVRKKLEYQLKEKLQAAVERAKHEWEAEQEEDRLALEEQHVKKLEILREKLKEELQQQHEQRICEIENEHLVKTEELEGQINSEKVRYKLDIETLQNEFLGLKQRCRQSKSNEITGGVCKASQTDLNDGQPWISLTETTEETPNFERLQEVRRQYLKTTAQLKEDFIQHVIETRKNAVKAIRSEVTKERHSIANQLRKYYLECLKQILDEDKEAYMNSRPTKSNEEKLRFMEEKLTLPVEKNENMKSCYSTLTNVTALSDTISESRPTENNSDSLTSRPDKALPRKPRDHSYNDVTKMRLSTNTRTEYHDGEVNVSRGQKHDHDRKNHKVPSSIQKDNKTFCKESTSWGVSSSAESLDSIWSSPVMELLGESSSDIVELDRGVESSSSDNGQRKKLNTDINTTELESRRSNQRGVHSNVGNRKGDKQSPRERTLSNHQRVTNTRQDDRYARQCAAAGHLRDGYFNEPNMHLRNTHWRKRSTRENIQNTQSHQDEYENMQDTPSQENNTRENVEEWCETTKVVTHPVIKSGNPSRMTSSLRRTVGDVLPSKPLSPTSPQAFSYTMHSRRNANK